MPFSVSFLLNKIDQKLGKFFGEMGILEQEDLDTIQYKLQRIVERFKEVSTIGAQSEETAELSNLFLSDLVSKVHANLSQATKMLNLGMFANESEVEFVKLLKQTRRLVKGLALKCELEALDFDEDMPEWVEEMLEPYIDPDTGEVTEPKYVELYGKVLNLHRSGIDSATRQNDCESTLKQSGYEIEKMTNDFAKNLQIDLGEGLIGHANALLGHQLDIQNQRQATIQYFEPTNRTNCLEIAQATEQFCSARMTGKAKLEVSNAGELIIAAAQALHESALTQDYGEFEEKVEWKGITISARRRPSKDNIGNLVIRNLGAYGFRSQGSKGKKGILEDFEEICQYSGESKLIEAMLKYGIDPDKITHASLNLPDNHTGTKLLEKFKQNCYLIYCAEIFRYFPMISTNEESVPMTIPFAVALALGLELLQEEKISLAELFEADAPLGLPTGRSIMQSATALEVKLSHLMENSQTILADDLDVAHRFLVAFPQARISREVNCYVEDLQRTFGRPLTKQ